MNKTISKDGTAIAFERTGQGSPVILVTGAFNDRRTGAALASWLAPHFTVFSYDRRGRGDSADAAGYAIEREIEDLAAVIRAAGTAASVFGYSSGAALALDAAARGLPITRLALFELPPAQSPEHAGELAALVAAGRRGDAVEYFQRRMVGIPEQVIAELRHAPFRPALEAMAHTLSYDATLMDYRPRYADFVAKVRMPTLALAGGRSPASMRETAAALAGSLSNARSLILAEASHDIVPELLGPPLQRFFADSSAADQL